MKPIPNDFLSKLGTYPTMNIHGESITVEAIDSALLETRVSSLHYWATVNNEKVVGVDIKKIKGSQRGLLVFRTNTTGKKCIIFNVDCSRSLPNSVMNFFEDNNICFVGRQRLYDQYFSGCLKGLIVGVGDLVARGRKKPSVTICNVMYLAREVGVRYYGAPTGTGSEIQVDSRNPKVLTPEMAKAAVSDACAYYMIARKLLCSRTSG